MFSNLTQHDKVCFEAFFSLLDEYFASRPHLNSQSQTAPAVDISSHPSRAVHSLSPTSLSPPPSAGSGITHHTNTSHSPSSQEKPHTNNAAAPQQPKPDIAQRFINSSVRYGTTGTKSSMNAISRNKDAMNLLGKVGMSGVVGRANEKLNSPKVEDNKVREKAVPPTITPKKGGVAGLVSSRTFGHVDTSSKMNTLTSMWKDPQKAQQPTVQHQAQPALSHSQKDLLPPPTRRDGSGSYHTTSPGGEEQSGDLANGAQGQAQALYDYTSSDGGDLSVQANQVVNIIEKTSADWWTCEDGNGKRGLVPANYVQEL
ncbi:uncharacterized protein L203_100553 [Cryptococcus depauperatus CBS 7841]|uniref:SH3 domain-containing protein n=1 Tax=Cryptococcus depauperatus CBS 7841 TaxID=1295531 RepID=A0AAJ8JNA0_9TREE